MTRQEYYDLLVRSATDGTFPSANKDGECLYRYEDDKGVVHRCAVGVVIPDRINVSKYESMLPQHITEHFPEGMSSVEMRCVQSIHDECAGDPWEPKKFIKLLNLSYVFKDCELVDVDGDERG